MTARGRSTAGTVSPEHERRVIRDAMQRLIDGTPIRSDGKLTVKSLAAEADVKRWVLTHKHPDLQDEFRARVVGQGQTPASLQDLVNRCAEQQARIDELSRDLATARATIKRYARVVQVLTLENDSLRSRTGEGVLSQVVPLRRP